jgi:hypothetical protein
LLRNFLAFCSAVAASGGDSIRQRCARVSAYAAACVCALSATLLAGCATPDGPRIPILSQPVTQTIYVPIYVEVEKPVTPAPTPAPEPLRLPEDQEQSLSLLAEFARTSGINGDELRKDHGAAQNAYNKEKSHVNRLRLAWYSAMLGPSVADDARLAGLLEPIVAKTGGLATSHPMRAVADMLLLQVNERGRQVREQAKKVDELQQKLDALKAIEKQLLDRERRRN